MAAFSLFPSYVQVYYHSPWAPHVMTIPTLQWNDGASGGTFDTWAAGTTGADGMINDFIDQWATLFTSEIEFDYYSIFNFPAEDEDPINVYSGSLAILGTVTPGTINNKAVQLTISWGCSGGSLLKTVGMDANAPTDFLKVGPIGIITFIPLIVAQVTSAASGWASRAGEQPLFGKQVAYTLNEKLRRSYHEN